MGKRNLLAVSAALILGTAFGSPALAAGSDVVHYSKVEANSDTAIAQHYDIGIPVPRVRAFVKAPWADATSRAPDVD